MNLKNVYLVARREVRANLFKRSMLIGSGIVLALLIAGSFFARPWVADQLGAPEPTPVGLSSEMEGLGPVLEGTATGLGVPVTTQVVADAQTAKKDLESEAIDLYISGTAEQPEFLYWQSEDARLTQAATAALQSWTLANEIQTLGGNPAEVMATVSSVVPTVSSVEPPPVLEGANVWVAMISIALLFFAIIMTGSFVSIGVVEEKTSRVVEILLATIRPTELFTGKVLGNGIVGLCQILVYGIGIVAAVNIAGLAAFVPVSLGSQLAWTVLWFVLGFATYVVIWGGLASLVSRQEDIGSVTTPVMFLLFIPFYAGMYIPMLMPDSDLTRVLSMVPFMSPFMIPMRMGLGGVPLWEMGVAMATTLAAVAALIWLASRIYQNGVMHTGSKMKFSDALKSHR